MLPDCVSIKRFVIGLNETTRVIFDSARIVVNNLNFEIFGDHSFFQKTDPFKFGSQSLLAALFEVNQNFFLVSIKNF